MSTEINDGGPAFPAPAYAANITDKGMTLRDYFAGQALAGILSSDNKPECDDRKAEWAYSLADSMLFFRKESNT
jgi:hypothetical protein